VEKGDLFLPGNEESGLFSRGVSNLSLSSGVVLEHSRKARADTLRNVDQECQTQAARGPGLAITDINPHSLSRSSPLFLNDRMAGRRHTTLRTPS